MFFPNSDSVCLSVCLAEYNANLLPAYVDANRRPGVSHCGSWLGSFRLNQKWQFTRRMRCVVSCCVSFKRSASNPGRTLLKSAYYDINYNERVGVCVLYRFYASGLNCVFSSAVPTASILGGPDLYVDKGSTINLTCAIRFSPEPPAYIFWYHLDEVTKLFSYYCM